MNAKLPEGLIDLLNSAADELLQWHHGSALPERLMAASDELSRFDAPAPDEGTENDLPQKYHFYALNYIGDSVQSGDSSIATTYSGYPDKLLTLSRIEEAKAHARVGPNSTLVAATYLGYMSKEEFTANSSEDSAE